MEKLHACLDQLYEDYTLAQLLEASVARCYHKASTLEKAHRFDPLKTQQAYKWRTVGFYLTVLASFVNSNLN